MRFEVKKFKGMRPSVAPDVLDNGEAQSAANTRLTNGVLTPIKAPLALTLTTALAGGTQSIYRFGQAGTDELLYWFQSTLDCDFVRGAVLSDTTERTYWTDGVYPKKTNASLATSAAPYPSSSYRLGIPAPASAGSQAVTGSPTNTADPAETVIYCLTYVTSWGEEGPPCVVSSSSDIKPGNSVSVTALPVVPTGTYNSANTAIVGKRLYRSATGSSSTKFQLVNTEGDIPVATTTYTDAKLTKNLGDVLLTTGWIAPPDDMRGLCEVANGFMAGFSGNTLCLSERGAPWAWPLRYQRPVDGPIVGIMAFDQSILVGTGSSIYIFTGVDPANMSAERVPQAISLQSKRSLVKMNGGIMFAAQLGVFFASAAGVRNVTLGYVTAPEWAVFAPSTIHAYEYEGRYIAFYGGASPGGVMLNLDDNEKLTFSLTTTVATAGYRDNRLGGLYLVVGGTLQKWDAGTLQTQTWQSGIFNAPYPINMSCGRVLGDTYPITFYVYNDSSTSTVTVADALPFRLASGFKGRRISFLVSGAVTIREVVVATSMIELGSGSSSG